MASNVGERLETIVIFKEAGVAQLLTDGVNM
jgi:hypothetical protein